MFLLLSGMKVTSHRSESLSITLCMALQWLWVVLSVSAAHQDSIKEDTDGKKQWKTKTRW